MEFMVELPSTQPQYSPGGQRPPQEAVVALGMFDGMHIGHRALVRQGVEIARTLGCVAGVYTFTNHPMAVLGDGVGMLSAPAEREAALRALGVEDVRMAEFTPALAAMRPEEFVGLLMEMWSLRGVVVGFNYTFGDKGLGTPETLAALGERYGFFTRVLPPVEFLDAPVSSSRIRACVEAGDMASAAGMLGRPYRLSGPVIRNRRIGRRIGFPTANLAPDGERALPKRGVYATKAAVEGATYPSVTNVGMNPTVNGGRLSIETHMIGFDGDVYGKTLTVEFCAYLRGERRFGSVEALKAQIGRDVEQAKALVGKAL